ncbi:hypothetical protein [Embleya sp. NBC_00896]|uniref:hypothetical protein n=1 Tax=Embleya sp. NBC_00896 TaxID=2975961 RepID=UPI0038646953|nr:hypothetical protein OG928_41585 [Embleya sp. NBC_00896]
MGDTSTGGHEAPHGGEGEEWLVPPSPSRDIPPIPTHPAVVAEVPEHVVPEVTDGEPGGVDPGPVVPGAHGGDVSEQPVHVTFNASGPNNNLAVNQRVTNYWKGDFVRPVPVPAADLEACAEHRFLAPRVPGQLEAARRLLATHGVVILSAAPGNGRRTAALRLLQEAMGTDSRAPALFDLEPEWSKPDVERLPTAAGEGYVLDLSEFAGEEPDGRFGRGLVDYGREGLDRGSFLVILAAPQAWRGAWVEPTLDFTVGLSSPDAWQLVAKELEARSAFDRVDWLADSAFEQIWESNPSAQEARRLARIVVDAKEGNLATIVDEFRGWQEHIQVLLNKVPSGSGEPSLLSMRATMWAGALLHGGQSRSILRAADALLERLAVSRTPGEVLADATSSRRLDAAHLTDRGGHAFHAEDKHDLAAAILQNLWEEFPTQLNLLRSWAVSVAADPAIPEEDAQRVTTALVQLATAGRDGGILDEIGKNLAGRRRPLAVAALTTAALDPQIGAFVRNRLYLWAKTTSSEETIKLVTEICGGQLGLVKPEIALTRLRWAAGQSPFGARSVTDAFRRLVSERPDEVGAAVGAWLDDEKLPRQGLVVFLALASSDEGAAFLLRSVNADDSRRRFVRAWQRLLEGDDARDATNAELDRWGDLAQRDIMPQGLLIDVFADVFAPAVYRSSLNRFFARGVDLVGTFWGQVLEDAIVRNRHDSERRAR